MLFLQIALFGALLFGLSFVRHAMLGAEAVLAAHLFNSLGMGLNSPSAMKACRFAFTTFRAFWWTVLIGATLSYGSALYKAWPRNGTLPVCKTAYKVHT